LAVVDSSHVFLSQGWCYPLDQYNRYWSWDVTIKERLRGDWTERFHAAGSWSYWHYRARRLVFLDTLVGWHSGQYGVSVRTNDGGTSWSEFASFEDSSEVGYDASFIDQQPGWAAWNSVGRTTNGGDSWFAKTADIGARRIQMFDSLSGWVMTTSGLLHTMDGGDSWTTVVAQSGLKAMRFLDPSNGVAVGSGGLILRTTDAGNTWLTDTAETSLDLYAVWMVDSVHAWAAGDSGVVLGMGDWALPGVEEQAERQPARPELTYVWPNPCRGTLWLALRGGTGSVVVYDDCGRPVASVQCAPARAEKLDLQRLPAGVYFARVLSSPQASARFVLLR
jgi:hypothetical protein